MIASESDDMLSSLFESTQIPVLEQVASFAQARHQVLAGNIANLDTPGYKTRDLSPSMFEDRLRRAIEEGRRSHDVSPLAAAGKDRDKALGAASKNLTGILRHDETNVGIEQQVAEIAKNHMRHNLALSLLNSQFRLLQTAISERV